MGSLDGNGIAEEKDFDLRSPPEIDGHELPRLEKRYTLTRRHRESEPCGPAPDHRAGVAAAAETGRPELGSTGMDRRGVDVLGVGRPRRSSHSSTVVRAVHRVGRGSRGSRLCGTLGMSPRAQLHERDRRLARQEGGHQIDRHHEHGRGSKGHHGPEPTTSPTAFPSKSTIPGPIGMGIATRLERSTVPAGRIVGGRLKPPSTRV